MSRAQDVSPPVYYIGWDVGAWNCDKNGRSRDAIAILDANQTLLGEPWRGSLRQTINKAANTNAFVASLFALCKVQHTTEHAVVTLAIDAPLGFSEAFVRLVANLQPVDELGPSQENPYLYRHTERLLFEHGLKPLSAVNHMIGSQATKGIHALAKFAPTSSSCGVWCSGRLTAIEAYPAACKHSASIGKLRKHLQELPDDPTGNDKKDALTCALVAYLFAEKRHVLLGPESTVPSSEGWIWVPKDALHKNQ